VVKYDTYVDSLRSAINLRLKKAGERKLEKSLARRTSFERRESLDLISRTLSEVDGDEDEERLATPAASRFRS
jgi:PH/SEC7 domain-containing protein